MPTTTKPNRLKFTQANVQRLKPSAGSTLTFWDINMPGFGVRVSPLGRKTWIAQYRVRGIGQDGKDVEVAETFGTADKVSLSAAQTQARSSFAKAREGIHPGRERKQQAAAEQAKKQQDAFTFKLLSDRYMAEYVRLNCKASTARENRRLLDRACLCRISPTRIFGELSVNEITPGNIDALMAACKPRARYRQTATHGLVEANALFGTVQRCFKWARSKRLIEVNPTLDMPKPLKKVPTRDRVLDDDEIVAFWSGCDMIGWPFGAIFKLLLLTGQRLREVADMTWSELGDLDNRTWRIPATRAKNGRAHEVALSDLAIEIINSLPRFADGHYVFASPRDDDQPVCGFVYAKQRVVDFMNSPEHWRLHDLRRTATTGMARLKVPPHVADKVLNHQSGVIRGTALIYNRFAYLDDRCDALNQWGDCVARLVGATIVALPTPAERA